MNIVLVFIGGGNRWIRAVRLAGRGLSIRGLGFPARSRIHTAKILRLSEDLPIVVECVASAVKIAGFLPTVEGLFERSGSGGLITLEKVDSIRYTPGGRDRWGRRSGPFCTPGASPENNNGGLQWPPLRFWIGKAPSGALAQHDNIAFILAEIDLPRARDLLILVKKHLLPLGKPA